MAYSYRTTGLQDLNPGDHVCRIYSSGDEYWAAVAAFAQAGLARNERVIVVVTDDSDSAPDELRSRDVAVDAAVDLGQLLILTADQTYIEGGHFDPERSLGLLREATGQAVEDGHAGLRIAGERSRDHSKLPGMDDFSEYESRVNEVMAGIPCTALCMHDREELDPTTLTDGICTHPKIAIGPDVYENPGYIPPDEFLGHTTTSSRIDRQLGEMVRQAEATQNRARLVDGLRNILDVADELLASPDADTLYRRAVELGREKLGVERMSIYIRDGDDVRGTYGTTVEGKVVSESHVGGSYDLFWPDGLPPTPPDGPRWIRKIRQDDEGVEVGSDQPQGVWYVMTPVWAPSGALGAIYNDCAITGCELDETLQELVSVYASLLGPIIERAKAEDSGRERERYLKCLAEISADLLSAQDLDAALPIALERLREVTDVDRCHLFENHLAADGVLRASLRYEAMAEGISSKLGEDDVTNVPWDPQYEHWARALSFGEPVHGPAPEVRAMAGDAEMEPGTGTLAMLPLHVGQQWHGVLAFSTEDSAREWSHQQMQLLGTAAATISAAIGRVQGDRAVQEGLHLEQQIVDAIPTPVFYKDAERRYLGSNRAFQEIMGRSKEDIEGRTAAEVTPDKNTIGHDEADDRVFGGPSTEVYETRVLAADGTSLDMVIHKAPFRNVDGNVAGLVGIAMDITERKAQEAAVEESERKYRELVENANSIILRLDPEGRITFFNEFAQQFFGYSEDEILGRHVVGSIAPEIDSSGRDLREMVDDALANPEEYGTNENENITKDGKRVLVAWRNKPILSEDGEYVGMTAVGTDVTEQRAAEEDARLFRELVNQSFDAVFIVDAPSGVLLDCNDRASMAFGYSREELLEMELLDLDATVEVDFSWQGGVEILKDSSGIVRETVYRRKDGSTLPVEVSLRHITSDARDYIVAVARDVSERKKLEQQLAQAAKMEAVGQLAGGVAHDFNNILTGISGYTDFVLANLAPDSTAHEDLTHVRGLADRASSLTRQLLAFSRRQTMEPTTLQVNMLIENLLKMLGRLVGEDIQLEFKPDATLGTCRADPAQIEQVVINLAVNARDAMPEGGRLTISATNAVVDRELSPDVGPGEYVLISVRDTGQGMDEDTSSRIFEPFFTTKEIGSGTGLGLAMVYGIVEQHGGHVEVESALGEGSVFRVYLARSDGADPEVEEDVDPGGPGRGTILFVEDDVEIQPIIRRILTSRGYEVLVASSPSEAEALFDKRQADISLLLTDVVMPESTGMALYQTLARKRADLRVLYTSGYTPEEIAKRGELDADAPFLQKPFTGAELARKVRGLLEEST